MDNLEKDRAEHLRVVSIHELCHAFVVSPRSLGLLLTLSVNRFYGRLPGHKAWDGRVTVKVLDDDLYQDSIYGWAGIVGEAIENDRARAVELAWKRYECGRQTVSDTDLKNIESVATENRHQTAQTAYEVLWGKWDEIKSMQGRVISLIEGRSLENLEIGWMKEPGWFGLD